MEELSASEFARLTAEEKRSYLAELSNEECDSAENNYVSDSDDAEWFPVPDKRSMSSKISDHEEMKEEPDSPYGFAESETESDDEIDEEANQENEGTPVQQRSVESCADFVAKDKTVWARTPTVQRQQQQQRHTVRNVFQQRSGPHRDTETLSMADTFKVIFTDEMVDIIVRHTNRKASQVYRAYNEANPTEKQLSWKSLTSREFYGFLGILISSGLNNSNYDYTTDMWRSSSYPLYRATMGINRFWNILRFVRFDNNNTNTRDTRIEEDKVAPIRDIWTMLNSNLAKMYKPAECLKMDEQIFPCRGRTRSAQRVPSKPAKNKIKVWWICDAENSYPLQGQICAGKTARVANRAERAVKELALPYKDSGRNITMDTSFTSLPLAKFLMSWNLTMVGTLSENKRYIPIEMAASRSRDVYSSLFGFHGNVTICSYVPKRNMATILLSTMHADTNVSAARNKKPEIIRYYDKTKIGVHTMDQILGRYTTRRRTNRWSLAFFYNIVDVAGFAAYTLYHENNKMIKNNTNERRCFLRQLGKELCMPLIEDRSKNSQIMRNFSTKNAVESIFGRSANDDISIPSTSSKQKYDLTGRKIVVGLCHICNKGAFKKRRKTRKACEECKKPVCNEHTITITYCIACIH